MKDKEWKEVMELAEKFGFLIFSYGGVAVLNIEGKETEDES